MEQIGPSPIDTVGNCQNLLHQPRVRVAAESFAAVGFSAGSRSGSAFF